MKKIAIAAAALMMLAACGGGSKSGGQIGSSDLLPGETTTLAPDTVPAGQPGAATGTPTAHHSKSGQATNHTGSGSSGGDVNLDQPISGVGDNPAYSSSGGYARTLLQPAKSSRIELQLYKQAGITIDMNAMQYVANMVQKVSGKPVSLTAPIALPGGSQDWTTARLNQYADLYGTKNQPGAPTAILHWLFVHGTCCSSGAGTGILGVAARADVEVIFPDNFQANNIDNNRDRTATYTHETGHLMGLVDEVLHEGRGDPNDPSHCMCHSPDKKSVMYWALDQAGGIIALIAPGASGVPIDFDSADYGDLARIRGGA